MCIVKVLDLAALIFNDFDPMMKLGRVSIRLYFCNTAYVYNLLTALESVFCLRILLADLLHLIACNGFGTKVRESLCRVSNIPKDILEFSAILYIEELYICWQLCKFLWIVKLQIRPRLENIWLKRSVGSWKRRC